MPLTRQVALITAVGRGLSRGIALTFGRDGAATCSRASMAPEAQGPQAAEPLTAGIVEATALTAATRDLAMALASAQVQAALQQAIEARQQAEAALQAALMEIAQLHDRLQAEHVDLHDALARDHESRRSSGTVRPCGACCIK
jgi:NAD(P)-dependent dehydrogenase (short-subunit alcohol dehydrogenase family)